MNKCVLNEPTFNHLLPKQLLNSCFIENEWVILYKYQRNIDDSTGIDVWVEYTSYIIEPSLSENLLNKWSCDFDGTGRCAIWGETNKYTRFSTNDVEPLVSVMNFYQMPHYCKQIRIHEDFIYLFNLLERVDSDGNRKYIQFRDGEETVVITVVNDEVRILHRFLNDYLAARRMNMVCHVHSEANIKRSLISEIEFQYTHTGEKGVTTREDNCISNFSVYMNSGIELQSWFSGKKIIPYKEYGSFKSTFDPDYADFIIGYDTDTCCDIIVSCNDPQYKYKRTFFKKAVVEKYIDDQNASIDQHSISSTYFYLKCDNDNTDYVWAYLKDLQCLPYSEQLRWKSFNFNHYKSPSASYQKMNNGCWKFNASSPEFVFKHQLEVLNKSWDTVFGWKLFIPFNTDQSSISNQLTVLGSNNRGACLKLIQRLNLILSERINVVALKQTGLHFEKNQGRIVKLSIFLESKGIHLSPFINYLLQLNTFRSELSETHIHASEISDKLHKACSFFEFDIDNPDFRKLSIALFQQANDSIRIILSDINNL